jgi:hypothetical protein
VICCPAAANGFACRPLGDPGHTATDGQTKTTIVEQAKRIVAIATVIFYQDSDYPNRGIVRLYGHRWNMNNHRGDIAAWVDITNQLQ